MAKQSHPYKSKENIHSSKLEEPSAAYVSADLRGTYLDIVSEDMFRSAISKACLLYTSIPTKFHKE